MPKTQLFLLIFIICLTNKIDFKTSNALHIVEASSSLQKQQRYIPYMKWQIKKTPIALLKLYELQQSLLDEIEKENLERKNQEEMRRKKFSKNIF